MPFPIKKENKNALLKKENNNLLLINNKLKKTDRVPLQVQRSFCNVDNGGGRVVLSAFQGASITLESAIVIPVFLIAIISVMYFMVIIYTHLCIQISIEEMADDLTTKMYAISVVMEKAASVNGDTETEEDNYGEDIYELAQKGVTAAYLYGKLIDKLGYENISGACIVNGAAGLDMTSSEFDMDAGIGNIIVCYKVKIPFLSESIKTLSFVQKCRFRFWTGVSLENTDDKNIVYITPTGTVYHLDLMCRHLDLSISKTTYEQMLNERNSSGAKYSRCANCCTGDISGSSIVYITESGTKYHSSLSCSSLKRGIITIDLSEVEDKMSPCSSCGYTAGDDTDIYNEESTDN